jgi:hypothetical protein
VKAALERAKAAEERAAKLAHDLAAKIEAIRKAAGL